MKKTVTAILVSILLIVPSTPSYGANDIGVTLDNAQIAFDTDTGYPFIDSNGRTLVPLREIMEVAGFEVDWNSPNQVATVSDEYGTKVYVKIGDNYITKEIHEHGITETSRIKNDTFAQVVNGRTYLPIRAVLECFGAAVSWDKTSHTVIVNTSGVSTIPLSAEQIYSKYSPAVFYIEIFDENQEPIATGSGFFIDSNGTAITNYHVIEGAKTAKAVTADGKTYDVEGVYDFNASLDIAKIKINGTGFSYVHVANNAQVAGGSKTYAIGSPLGLDNTISEGIISNPKRMIDGVAYYQITTPISPGSSGGALFDAHGNVIGITSGGFADGQNLNLAIPIANIHEVAGTTLTKFGAISSKKGTKKITFSISKNSIDLDAGKSTNILLSCEDFDSAVDCSYFIEDESIATATWGDWTEQTLPLYIEVKKPGNTTLAITLNDYKTGEILSTKTVPVNISKEEATLYYDGYYPAPNLGQILGIEACYEEKITDGKAYYYDGLDLQYVSPNADFIEAYTETLLKNGFILGGSSKDEEGDTVVWYEHQTYDLTMYMAYKNANGTSVYIVLLLQDK